MIESSGRRWATESILRRSFASRSRGDGAPGWANQPSPTSTKRWCSLTTNSTSDGSMGVPRRVSSPLIVSMLAAPLAQMQREARKTMSEMGAGSSPQKRKWPSRRASGLKRGSRPRSAAARSRAAGGIGAVATPASTSSAAAWSSEIGAASASRSSAVSSAGNQGRRGSA